MNTGTGDVYLSADGGSSFLSGINNNLEPFGGATTTLPPLATIGSLFVDECRQYTVPACCDDDCKKIPTFGVRKSFYDTLTYSVDFAEFVAENGNDNIVDFAFITEQGSIDITGTLAVNVVTFELSGGQKTNVVNLLATTASGLRKTLRIVIGCADAP